MAYTPKRITTLFSQWLVFLASIILFYYSKMPNDQHEKFPGDLSFPYTEQVPHFERPGFKIIGRRMLATYLEKNNTANVFLPLKDKNSFVK